MAKYSRFLTTPEFRKAFSKLPPHQQEAAKAAVRKFKADPFAPSLRTHMIKKLSARYRRTIYAVEILGDLRAVFFLEGSEVISFDIGSHDIYK